MNLASLHWQKLFIRWLSGIETRITLNPSSAFEQLRALGTDFCCCCCWCLFGIFPVLHYGACFAKEFSWHFLFLLQFFIHPWQVFLVLFQHLHINFRRPVMVLQKLPVFLQNCVDLFCVFKKCMICCDEMKTPFGQLVGIINLSTTYQ